MDFHSHFADDSDHNSATTFEHTKKFIHWMYDNNLFIKYVIMYNNTDGCSKQYICANAMWVLSVLEFTHRVIIYRFVDAPGHGGSKIYGINGAYKK